MRTLRLLAAALSLCALTSVKAWAQESGEGPVKAASQDIITPHITDAHAIDLPCFKAGWVCEVELPRWAPIHIGSFAIDISPTKHVVWLGIAAILCLITMMLAARAHRR